MSTQYRGGSPMIQVLASDGVTVLRTLELPTPTKGGVKLHWKEKAIPAELLDGAERRRRLGFTPVLNIRWKIFDDVSPTEKPRGPLDGNRARFQDLLGLLANPQGRLRVSPGPAPFGATAVTDHGFGVGDGATTTFQLQQAAGRSKVNALGETWPAPTTPRTNRIPRSADLTHASWTKINGGTGVLPTVTGNYGLAPDGTLTADRVVCQNGAGATGSDYSVVKIADVVGAMPPNQRTTRSIWLKSNTGGNLAASLGSNGNAGAITITPSWQRFTYTYYHPTLTLTHTIDLGLVGSIAGNTNATVDFLAWEGQLEEGLSTTENIHTDAAAVTVTPSYWPSATDGFEPVYGLSGTPAIYRKDWQGKQLLYSTARTNGAAYSEDYSNAAWVKTNCTITPNFNVAPDGTTTADQWTASAVSASMYQALGSLAAGTYTISRFVKQALSPICHIGLYNVTDSAFVVLGQFTFATASMSIVGGSGTFSVTPLANGWYRISVTGTIAAPKSCQQYFYGRSTGAGNTIGDTVVVWGEMQETGSVPTAYIPTTSSAVTVTDYTLTSTGTVTFSAAPLSSAVISWSGSFQEVRRGFRALVTKMPDANQIAGSIAAEVEVEFTGYDILSEMSMGVF